MNSAAIVSSPLRQVASAVSLALIAATVAFAEHGSVPRYAPGMPDAVDYEHDFNDRMSSILVNPMDRVATSSRQGMTDRAEVSVADSPCGYGHCCDCAPAPLRGWVTADYLHWWMQGDRVPALVTTSPAGTPRANAGVLGLPTTSVLYGDERLVDSGRPGLRLDLGRWLDDCESWGVGTEIFWLGEDDDDFNRFSQGDPILARPFFNTDPGVDAEDAELVAFDDVGPMDILDGRVRVDTSSEVYSVATYFHHLIACRAAGDCGYHVDLFGGYRFFRLDENLRISEALLVTESGGAVAQGTTIDLFDEFDASNEFHGGEFGVKTRVYRGQWSAQLLAKLAVGGVHQKLRINGQTTTTVPGFAPATATGGLLAQTTNIGTLTDDQFALLPEVQLSLAYQLDETWSARIGYTLLYLTESVRPGQHVDNRVDGRFLDPMAPPFTATNPAVTLDSTSVWMMGLNLGVEALY